MHLRSSGGTAATMPSPRRGGLAATSFQRMEKVAREAVMAKVPHRSEGEETTAVVGTLAAGCVSHFFGEGLCLSFFERRVHLAGIK